MAWRISVGLRQIVHAGALQLAVGNVEAGRLDHVDCHAEAGAEAHDRAGVLGYVGLIERKGNHGAARFLHQ